MASKLAFRKYGFNTFCNIYYINVIQMLIILELKSAAVLLCITSHCTPCCATHLVFWFVDEVGLEEDAICLLTHA